MPKKHLIVLSAGLKIRLLNDLQGRGNYPDTKKKQCPGYNTKLQKMENLQFYISRECGIAIFCYYSWV